MPELAEVETPKNAGYMARKRTSNKDRIEKDEKELKELLAQREGEKLQEGTEESEEILSGETGEEVTVSDKSLSQEERSWEKRHGDLRRYVTGKEKEYAARIKELEGQVGETKKLVPPKSDEDIAAWAKEYPDVAGIVETIAEKKAKQLFDRANIQIEELNKAKSEATRSRAENDIRESHKDFDKLRDSDEFHDWVDIQPKWVQNALYENTDDAASVVRVLDLYKVDKGLTSSDKKFKAKAAASLVEKGSKTNIDAAEMADAVKESDIAKMTDRQYEANQEKIQNAIRSGKMIYDLSGNRR